MSSPQALNENWTLEGSATGSRGWKTGAGNCGHLEFYSFIRHGLSSGVLGCCQTARCFQTVDQLLSKKAIKQCIASIESSKALWIDLKCLNRLESSWRSPSLRISFPFCLAITRRARFARLNRKRGSLGWDMLSCFSFSGWVMRTAEGLSLRLRSKSNWQRIWVLRLWELREVWGSQRVFSNPRSFVLAPGNKLSGWFSTRQNIPSRQNAVDHWLVLLIV